MPALDRWEQRLRPYFNQKLRLIAEIPMVRADVEDIASAVRAAIQRRGLAEVTRSLRDKFPLTFLVFLSAFAARNNEQNYWQALADLIGVQSSNLLFNYKWHRIFRDEAQKRGLRTFDWDEAANRYVATIRFHGGIPAYSLPDYFDRILLPSIQRAEFRGVDPDQVLPALLKTAYFVDSPVITFLENSGRLGLDFFKACQKMARQYLDNQGELLSPVELELPPYVVDTFGLFMEREDDRRFHLRKPGCFFALFSEDSYLWVKLPEQEIPLRYADGVMQWELTVDGMPGQLVRKGRLLRRRQDTLLEEVLLAVDAVPRSIQVTLVYQDEQGNNREVLRRWHLPVLPPADQSPLLAFRAANGQQIRPGMNLPSEPLVLVYPLGAELEFDGTEKRIQELGPLRGVWQGWQMHIWDLSDTWSLRILRHGQALGSPVPVIGRSPEPELTGGYLSAYGQDAGTSRLYIGEPPALRFPFRQTANITNELKKWLLKVRSVWETEPEIHLETSLDRYHALLSWSEDWAELPLRHILGEHPIGTYALQVMGPGDVDVDFRLRIWPKLTVIGIPSSLPTVERNTQPHTFTLRIPEDSQCEPQAGAGDIRINPRNAGWEVSAGAEVFAVNLNLLASRGQKKIRVPIQIPLPRLRWGLAQDESDERMSWNTHLLHKSINNFLQAGNQSLHIEMNGLGEFHDRLRLELVDFTETENSLQDSSLQITPFSADWLRVSLDQFKDTIRHGIQLGRLDLVHNPRYPEPQTRFPLVLFSRDLGIRDIRLEQVNPITWKVTWHEDSPLKNRRLLLNPAWQPWQNGWEYKIPDSARGEFLLENTSLPLTRYELAFYIAPTWEPERDTIPENVTPQIIDLVHPSRRIQELASEEGSHEQKFKALVETVCIYEDLGEIENREFTLSRCTKLFIHLTNLRLILGLLNWLDGHQIKTQYILFFYRQLFKPDLIKRLFEIYRPGDPFLQEYLNYTTRVKDMYAESAFQIASIADDPIVVRACLKHLLAHEDEILILLILEMIENARLSDADAVDLLAKKALWAVDHLSTNPSTPQVDRLIAALLPEFAREGIDPGDRLTEWIIRSLPHEKNPTIVYAYIQKLIHQNRTEGFDFLISAYTEKLLETRMIEDLLAIDPVSSFEIIQAKPASKSISALTQHMIDHYPQVAGVIKSGSHLNTPYGVGLVDYIENREGHRLPKARLNDPDIRINLLIGNGGDRVRVWVDNQQSAIVFEETGYVIQCGYCNFFHTKQTVLDRHLRTKHRYMSRLYKRLSGQVVFDSDQIKINTDE